MGEVAKQTIACDTTQKLMLTKRSCLRCLVASSWFFATLLSPLAWLTFSKLLELMPNSKGWGYDICLGRHLASGVDTSQHVFHTGSRVLAHARGKLAAALRKESGQLTRMCTMEWFNKTQEYPARGAHAAAASTSNTKSASKDSLLWKRSRMRS